MVNIILSPTTRPLVLLNVAKLPLAAILVRVAVVLVTAVGIKLEPVDNPAVPLKVTELSALAVDITVGV